MYGFKFWEIEIAVMVLTMILVGIKQYHLSDGVKRIKRRFNERFFKFLSLIFTAIFVILFMNESSDILIRYGYSCLTASDSEFYVIPIAAVAGMTIASIFYAASYFIGTIAGYAKRGYLEENLQ